MRSLIGLLLALLIVFATYKLFFNQLQSTGGASPARSIDVAGVKNDLVAIAQAERIYQVEHSSYATLEQLVSSGAMALAKPGRNGYTYEAEPSDTTFRIVAHCPVGANPGCSSYAVDETMDVRPLP
jgi:hypothetical protein